MRELAALLRPDGRDLGIVIAFSIAVAILALTVPIAAQMLINYVAFGALMQPLITLGFVVFLVLTLAAMMRLLITYVVELIQRRLFVRTVSQLGDRLPRVQRDTFDLVNGPEMVNRFFDVLTLQKIGAILLLEGVAALLQTVVGLIIVAFYHPFLLGFSGALLAASAFVIFVLGRSAVRTAIAESTVKYRVVASLEEIAANNNTYKQSDAHALAFRRADEGAKAYVNTRKAHFRVVFRQVAGALAIQVVALSSLLMIGGYLVITGQLTLGQLVAAELIVSVALASFTKIAQKLDGVYDMFAGVHKLTDLLSLPLERETGEQHRHPDGPADVRFKGVRFAYPGGRVVFDGFDLELAPNERVALIGQHGAGKSTIADMLLAARAPDEGRVELDGVDLRELRTESIRHHIAVVGSVEITPGSIEENVRMGRPDTSLEECRVALDRVGLLDEVRSLPEGLGTRLSSSGAPLSMGQRQRLMLARALAGRPRLLVIDDLLDDMDARGRARIADLLADRSWLCTVLVLTRHRWVGEIVERTVWMPTDDDPSGVRPSSEPQLEGMG